MFCVISVYFNIMNTLPKSGTFLLGHPVYVIVFIITHSHDEILYQNFLSTITGAVSRHPTPYRNMPFRLVTNYGRFAEARSPIFGPKHSSKSSLLTLAAEGYIYTECPRRNVRDFGRVFLMLKYTDITQNTYIQS